MDTPSLSSSCNLFCRLHVPPGIKGVCDCQCCLLIKAVESTGGGANIPKSCHAQGEEAVSPVIELWQSQVVEEEGVHNRENVFMVALL